MKISYNWLKTYLNINIEPEKLSELLTFSGLEVEGFEKVESIKGGLEGLVVGEVLEKEKHPDADRLSVTKVDVGQSELLQIVCGAPNVAKGQKVMVATDGTTIHPLEGEPFKIKNSKIRGVASQGMICAEDEVSLGKSHEGILILPADSKVGTAVKDLFKMDNDIVFEIGLTPNRVDASSHFGVARDVFAVLKQNSIKVVKPILTDVSAFKEGNESFEVKVGNAELCPRYAGIVIKGIKVNESPAWLKNRLASIGVRSINNVVDITNFILHDLGQPLHAFDLAKVKGNKILVKTLSEGTSFKTLDGVERKLSSSDLMICNESAGMCLAGVFGGEDSGVSNDTTSIFLESAYFNPVTVRKSARRHGLSTDSSFRFERGTDPEMVLIALKKAALLLQEICGGTVASKVVDLYPNQLKSETIEFSYSYAKTLIGKEIPKNTIIEIIEDLGISILSKTEDKLSLQVPLYRVDVIRPADIVEEILRVYGYNNVEIPEKLSASVSIRKKPDAEKIKINISNFLSANGFNEALNNSLTNIAYYKGEEESLVHLLNPLSSELSVMRKNLLFGGLENAMFNLNRKESNLKFFEFGKVYQKVPNKYIEEEHLLLLSTGNMNEESWNTPSKFADFYFIKSGVESIFERLGVQESRLSEKPFNGAFGDGLEISLDKRTVGEYGSVSDELLKKFDIKMPVYYAIIQWQKLLSLHQFPTIKYKEISKFPSVRRDLALLLDKSASFSQVEEIARKSEKSLLKDVNLFDVYEGKNMEEGKKSYAVSFVLQDESKTLTDAQIDGVMKNILSNLEKELGAKLR